MRKILMGGEIELFYYFFPFFFNKNCIKNYRNFLYNLRKS